MYTKFTCKIFATRVTVQHRAEHYQEDNEQLHFQLIETAITTLVGFLINPQAPKH